MRILAAFLWCLAAVAVVASIIDKPLAAIAFAAMWAVIGAAGWLLTRK